MPPEAVGFEDDEDELEIDFDDEDYQSAPVESEAPEVQDESEPEEEPSSSIRGNIFSSAPSISFEDWQARAKTPEGSSFEDWQARTETKEGPNGIPTDGYREEVSKLLEDDSFWDQSYEKQVTSLRKLYLGDDLKGEKKFEDDDEIVGIHKELLSTVREYNGISVVKPEEYEDMLAPWPKEELAKAKGSRDVAAVLEKWEATSLSRGKANGGIYWRENEDLIEGQIADYVDGVKRMTVAEKNLPSETGVGGQLLGNFSTFSKAFLGTFATFVPGETGKNLRRGLETTPLLPESEAVLKGEVVLNLPFVGEVPESDIISGFGSGAATVVGGGTAAVLGVPKAFAAAGFVAAGARLGYAEAYDKVFQRTGSEEKAASAGFYNMFPEAFDSLFDAVVGAGLISPLKKGVSATVKKTALAELASRGLLGEGFQNGFRILGNAGIAGLGEGIVEVGQESISGEIEAHFANDPTLKRTPQQLGTAFVAGALTGTGGHIAAETTFLKDSDSTAGIEIGPIEPAELETQVTEEEKVLPKEETKSPTGAAIPAATETEQAQAAASKGDIDNVVEPETGKYKSLDDRVFEGERRLVPLGDLVVQKDVKQFKKDADPKTGVVGGTENLGDEFFKAQAGEIAVIEKDVTGNGELEVVSGRNRFALAQKDPSVNDIAAYVYKESDGFTIEDAKTMDAELNIRDDAGETIDYAKFFERAKIPREKARARGYLRKVKGLRGYNIGTHGSPELKAAYYSDKINEQEAGGIATAAPGNPDLQRAGMEEVLKGTPVETAVNTMRVLERAQGITSPSGETIDMFGNSSVMSDARALGKAATGIQKELRDAKNTLEGARKLSKKNLKNLPGVSADLQVNDPKAVKGEVDRLTTEITRWDNWSLHPDLVAQVQEKAASTLKSEGAQLGLDLTSAPAPSPQTKPAENRTESQPKSETAPLEETEPALESTETESPTTGQPLEENIRNLEDTRDRMMSRLVELADIPQKTAEQKKEFKSLQKQKDSLVKQISDLKQPKLIGTSAVAESQFGVSEVFEKLEATRNEAIDANIPEASPVTEETFEELASQEAGQYLITSHPEQEFFADRWIGDRSFEDVAKTVLDPEDDSLGELASTTQHVVLAKTIAQLDNAEREARRTNDTDRARELRDLATQLYIQFISGRSGAGQALNIGNLTNKLLGIAPADQVMSIVEDVINHDRKNIDLNTQAEMVALSQEADLIAQQELDITNQAAAVKAKRAELKLLRENLEKKKAELKAKQEKLREQKEELERERKKLEAARRRAEKSNDKLDAKSLVRENELKQKIAELEGLIEWNQNHLRLSQERFERVTEDLKRDVKSLQGIQRQIDKRRKGFIKREKELRQKRARTREKLIFRTLPSSVQAELKRLAEKVEAAPQGSFVRQELAGKMFELAIRSSGGFSPMEIFKALWYTNAVAGLSTQGINTSGNGLSLLFRSSGMLARNADLAIPYIQGLLSGGEKGWVEWKSIVKEGRSGRFSGDSKLSDNAVRSTIEMLQPQSVLESLLTLDSQVGIRERLKNAGASFKNNPTIEIVTGLGVGKFMGRMLRGGDAFFYRTSFDAMAAAVVARDAKNAGLSQTEVAKKVADTLFMSSERGKAALARAEATLKNTMEEGEYSERDVTRVAIEFMEQELPFHVQKEANRWGSLNTFTNTPEGMPFGKLAEMMNNAVSNWSVPTRWGEFHVLQPFFPFVNIVANVAETGLEFSPMGFGKAAFAQDRSAKIEKATNAVIGSALGAVAFGLAYANLDKDDPPIAIYGSGKPLTKERRDQLKETGWRPFTVKIGDLYIPYKETPLYWMSSFGAYFDNYRWNSKFDEKSGTDKLKLISAGTGSVFLDQAALQGISNLVSAMKGEIDPMSIPASYLGVFLPGGSFARDLDRIFNAEYQEVVPPASGDDLLSVKSGANIAGSFLGAMFRNYPVAGDMINRPLLNGFGEVIEPTFGERFGLIRRTLGTMQNDEDGPEWKFLAEHGLNFSGFKRTITIPVGKKGENAGVIKKRGELIGRVYADVLTPDERYRMIQIAGPQVKKEIQKIMAGAGKKTRAALQSEIDKAVTEVKKKSKVRFVHREMSQIQASR